MQTTMMMMMVLPPMMMETPMTAGTSVHIIIDDKDKSFIVREISNKL